MKIKSLTSYQEQAVESGHSSSALYMHGEDIGLTFGRQADAWAGLESLECHRVRARIADC